MIKLYSVLDKQSKTTQNPFSFQTHRDAIDGLRQVVNDENTTISKHSDDFDLYFLGEYDPRKMEFNISHPEKIASASDLKE